MIINTNQNLPKTGFVRIKQILAVIPVGASTWWTGVANGKYPKGIKLGARTTVWRAKDIHALIASLSGQSATHTSSTSAEDK